MRSLIVDSGLSQAAFSADLGLDPTKLSKSLSGARRFTSVELAQIADRCSVTVDWILTGEEPLMATAARAFAGSSPERAVAEAARLVELRESAARLGYPQEWRPVPLRTSRTLAYEQGTDLAAEASARLAALGLDVVTPDLAGLIEAAFGADVAITSLGDGFDGLAASTPKAKVIVVAVSAVPYRQRFTLAHELGHLLSGDDQGIHADEDIYSASGRKDPSEIRANAFAAAFLMPEHLLRGAVTPGFSGQDFAALAVRLLVSPAALAYRLENLRLIDAMASAQCKSMTAKEAARQARAPASIGSATAYATEPRIPSLLARDLFTAYLDEKTTLRPYASLLSVDAERLRQDLEREGES
ncbi:MAG: ImmA/IrrE family metallo-endopeptidase [Austwickia sp.]|nr:ImmA/IrrE family metallo-endopeptidase [Austwickia sp.]MBK9102520.1 ImmA/IrrE family metallo-endopeptidase [Austwickia sp.]